MKYPIKNEEAFLVGFALELLDQGKAPSAIALLLKIADIASTRFDINLRYAEACDRASEIALGDHVWSSDADALRQRAARHYGRASDVNRHNFDAAYGAAVFFQKLDDNTNVEKFALRAVRIKPKVGGAWLRLGQVMRDKGQLDTAVICFENAVIVQPDNRSAREELLRLNADVPSSGARLDYGLVFKR